jgi:hypothetical protein
MLKMLQNDDDHEDSRPEAWQAKSATAIQVRCGAKIARTHRERQVAAASMLPTHARMVLARKQAQKRRNMKEQATQTHAAATQI